MHVQRLITREEQDLLEKKEAIIRKGKKAFIEVGLALGEICEKKLYRQEFRTFQEYVQNKWGWTRQHAYRLIEGASVAECNRSVTNMDQAKALAKVDPEKRADVVEAASQQAETEGRKMTSQDIADAATVDVESEVVDEPETPTDTPPAPAKTPAGARKWTFEEYKKTIQTIRSEYLDECPLNELPRAVDFHHREASTVKQHMLRRMRKTQQEGRI